MRAAIYFVPSPDHPLSEAAARWFGRDLNRPDFRADAPGIGDLTATDAEALVDDPRRYGFHATLKPPFRIAEPYTIDDVEDELSAFCGQRSGFSLGKLVAARIGSFFALVPAVPRLAVDALAADAVRAFDGFRAPATLEEVERRTPAKLTDRQRSQLGLWGYPYVFEDFRFHMTLTGPEEARCRAVLTAISDHFADALSKPLRVDSVSLVVEPDDGSEFELLARHALLSPGLVTA